MSKFSNVLIAPVLSEKASAGKDKKKYTFRVAKDANKIIIKEAVENVYKVKVDKVNVSNSSPKYKKIRMNYGYTRSWKKATVTLKQGDIDFYKA